MLKQILRDMYVDPEILAGLDETQKQTLFCKMREEQIRRWKLWDKEVGSKKISLNENSPPNRKSQKRVDFLKGIDGKPWVWIMGEHENDKSIEEILAEEAQQKARKLALLETKELRKSVESEFSELIEFNQKETKKISDSDDELIVTPKITDDTEIYCSVNELNERKIKSINYKKLNNKFNTRLSNFNYTNQINENKKIILQEISLNNPSQVSTRIALWEQRVIGEKANEIFKRIQKEQQESAREAEEAAKKHDELWREQERKAKEAETQMREIARKAREEHRKSLLIDDKDESSSTYASNIILNQTTDIISNFSRPKNQEEAIKWFKENEYPKNAGLNEMNQPEIWFHGLTTRAEAEQRLMLEPAGTFLVRLSEKIWGYAISYKDTEKCKHYLVDALNHQYQFLGNNQLVHEKLSDMINYHATIPITNAGNELLKKPCPKPSSSVDPLGIF